MAADAAAAILVVLDCGPLGPQLGVMGGLSIFDKQGPPERQRFLLISDAMLYLRRLIEAPSNVGHRPTQGAHEPRRDALVDLGVIEVFVHAGLACVWHE